MLPSNLQTSPPANPAPLAMDESLSPEPETLPPHQEAMIEACKAGQVAELQNLFHEHDVKHGDDPIPYWHAAQEGAPATSSLFAAAISHGQQSIVQYLRSMYPKFDFYHPSIIHSLTETPDLEMLKLIYSYAPEIVRFAYDDHATTFLSLACEGGPQNAPVVDFLLDHGAMGKKGDDYFSYLYHLGVELVPAIQHDQPTEIIKKMVPKTSRLWLPINVAMGQKRADVLELLLNEEENRGTKPSSDGEQEQLLLRRAQESEDKKVMAVVERHLRNMEERTAKSAATARDVRSTRASTQSRRWWQFGARADSKLPSKTDAEGSSSATQTSTRKWWWPLSKVTHGPESADSYHQKKEPLGSASDEED